MGFFKPTAGSTAPTSLRRLDQLIWSLIYGGLLTLVVGLFVRRIDATPGTLLLVLGSLFALVGVALIYMRSGLHESKDKP